MGSLIGMRWKLQLSISVPFLKKKKNGNWLFTIFNNLFSCIASLGAQGYDRCRARAQVCHVPCVTGSDPVSLFRKGTRSFQLSPQKDPVELMTKTWLSILL